MKTFRRFFSIRRFFSMPLLYALVLALVSISCNKEEEGTYGGRSEGEQNKGYDFTTYSNGYEYGIRKMAFPAIVKRINSLPSGVTILTQEHEVVEEFVYSGYGYMELINSESDMWCDVYIWTNLSTGEMYLYYQASSPATGINNEGVRVVANNIKEWPVLVGNVYRYIDVSSYKYKTTSNGYFFN